MCKICKVTSIFLHRSGSTISGLTRKNHQALDLQWLMIENHHQYDHELQSTGSLRAEFGLQFCLFQSEKPDVVIILCKPDA